MTIDRNRAVEPSSSSWSAAEGSSTRTGPRRLAAFTAALAATVLMLSGTPAAAAPTFNTDFAITRATAGSFVTIGAEHAFDNAGTNARFTGCESRMAVVVAAPTFFFRQPAPGGDSGWCCR